MWELFRTFFQIGLFTFGGGYAMIAQIKETVVQEKHWLTDEELLEVIAIAESTPGPIAINLATYVGYKRKGVPGSVMATLGVVLPSFVILYTISLFLDAFLSNRWVAYAFTGIKCAVAYLILRAGLDLLKKLPRKALPMTMMGSVLALLLGFEFFAVSFSSIVFIAAGGLLGILMYGLRESEGNP
jgi:chromate transporter